MPKSRAYIANKNSNSSTSTVPSGFSNSEAKIENGVYKKTGFDDIELGKVHAHSGTFSVSAYNNGVEGTDRIYREGMLPIGKELSTLEAGRLTSNTDDFNTSGTLANKFADFYVGYEYEAFNEALTKGLQLTARQTNMYNAMIETARPLLQNATLYRFSTGGSLNKLGINWENPSNIEGKIVPITKLFSTAHSANVSGSYFSGRQVFTITRAPAGTYVNNLSKYNTGEKEIAITPGAMVKIAHAFNIPGMNGHAGYTVIIQDIIDSKLPPKKK